MSVDCARIKLERGQKGGGIAAVYFGFSRGYQIIASTRCVFDVIIDDSANALLVKYFQLCRQRHDKLRVVTEHFPMLRRQAIPGYGHVGVMRIVKSEIQRQPIEDFGINRLWIAESVRLLPGDVSLTRWLSTIEQCEAVAVIVLDGVHESKHGHHQQVRRRVKNRRFWIPD